MRVLTYVAYCKHGLLFVGSKAPAGSACYLIHTLFSGAIERVLCYGAIEVTTKQALGAPF